MAKPINGKNLEKFMLYLPIGSIKLIRIEAMKRDISASELIRRSLITYGIKLPTEQSEDKSTD